MNETFAALVSGLHPKFERLMSMSPCRSGLFPINVAKQGVYLFSEGGAHLYVGRSNTIRARWGRHCNPGATHRMAAFAFKLAREATGRLTASYKNDENSRKNLRLGPRQSSGFKGSDALQTPKGDLTPFSVRFSV